jgi:LemA protein
LLQGKKAWCFNPKNNLYLVMKNKGCMIAAAIVGVIGIVVLAIFMWGKGIYNNLVAQRQEVNAKWANVETVYQKRANLVPNLERTVKAYSKFEQETLTKVIEARAKASSIQIDASKMTDEDLARFQKAQGEFSGALSRLMVVSENYPNLKADQQFIDFQRELTAIENSIRTEMTYFNDAAKSYNIYRETFPNVVIANFTNFTARPYFKSEAGAEKAKEVFKD